MIQLNIDGLDAVRQQFARLVPQTQQQVLNGLAKVAFDSAQRQADTHTQTGALARSLFLKPQGESAWVIGHDLQHAPHALGYAPARYPAQGQESLTLGQRPRARHSVHLCPLRQPSRLQGRSVLGQSRR